jgi:hypothetical protein
VQTLNDAGTYPMPGERLSTHEIERFLQFQPRYLQDLLFELRGLVFKAAPHASERILWNGLSYHDAQIGGPVKGAICQLSIEGDHVIIGFIHGAFLPDPSGLLQGDRKSKRCLQVDSLEATPWGELEALLRAAAAYVERWR